MALLQPTPEIKRERISLLCDGIPDRNPKNWCRNCGHPESWHQGFMSFNLIEDAASSLLASPSRCFFTNSQGKLSSFCGCMHFRKPKKRPTTPRPLSDKAA